MSRSTAPDVQFDWHGSLYLAQRLWQLADQLDELAANRVTWAETALSTWEGRFAIEFAERTDGEVDDLAGVASELRGGALGWAQCWQLAMTEQNWRLYAREVRRVENNRSVLGSIWGGIVGHDDLPSTPHERPTPQPPSFAATGTFVAY